MFPLSPRGRPAGPGSSARWRTFAAGLLGVLAARGAEVEFNRDVRPILSENCFACHGQDEARREGKLRLDVREGAVAARDGIAAIVPGKPEDSELVRRIEAKDPTDVMPPPESHKTLTAAQVALLRRWVAEGASYQGHWAFIAPVKADAKSAGADKGGSERVAAKSGGRAADREEARGGGREENAIDAFVGARLAREGLRMSAEAPPGGWLRRASLDLTGLPPTVAELERFEAEVKSRGEAAYATAVDRLLGSVHYGERMAVEWLDAARYADTHGFNNDSARTMWRWRDWVIDAFNANLPYDRFITEQLAGDLLPRATIEQRIATGFGRNHVISSEGGIIDEEYRVEYVADRVRTMSTAWLGLTMECARCHDHKFDPIAQKDYYRLFAFFNNVPEHGEDGRSANAVPMMPAPTREQQALLAQQEKELARLDAEIAAARAKFDWRDEDRAKVEALVKTARAAVTADKTGVKLLEAEPAAAAAKPDQAPKTRKAASAKARSGAKKGGEPGAAAEASERVSAADGKGAAPGDGAVRDEGEARKVAAAKLDFSGKEGITVAFWLRTAADNPRDVALFSAMDHRGSPADTGYGKGRELRLIDGELELRICDRFPAYAVIVRSVGAKIVAGEWRHVALTYAGGRKAADVRFFVDGAEVATDVRYDDLFGDPPKRDFLVGTDNAEDAARLKGEIEDARSYPRAGAEGLVRALFRARGLHDAATAIADGSASERQVGWLREARLADEAAAGAMVAERDRLRAEHLALRRSLPTVMVMEELAQPRSAFVLNRGQYDQRGEPVEPGVPETLLSPWPEGAPRNRLGLARWLTDPRHPLTGRVVVNRFWAQFFGTGLVKTLEDFGSQSEWPSHPELLDWLARDFVDGGWDVKALVRQIVLSRTYRQSSAVTPELVARDPENRLLARGPRVRLPAEVIRDQALAVSGLLTPRIGGPSVYPYQPDKLYESVVVGAAYPGTTWGRSSEPDLFRRSLYTFWKRTLPHPAMTTFDAPDREFCTVRRSRTNTPLQALVLWNEPGLVEAARRFGTRLLREAPGNDAGRVAWAFQTVTGRKPAAEEIAVLIGTWAKLRDDFARRPDEAAELVKVGTSAVDGSMPVTELAAATALANVLLSLDEAITKN